MVDIPLTLVGNQVSVTTGTTVNGSGLLRAYAPTDVLVTISNSIDVLLCTMTMPAGTIEIITKNYDDKISANAALLCTPLAWR